MVFLTSVRRFSGSSERRVVKKLFVLGILKAFQSASAVSVSPAIEFWNII
jgi:hypothetical protein